MRVSAPWAEGMLVEQQGKIQMQEELGRTNQIKRHALWLLLELCSVELWLCLGGEQGVLSTASSIPGSVAVLG